MSDPNPFDDEADTDPQGAPVLHVEGNVVRYRGEAFDLTGIVFADDVARIKRLAAWLDEVNERQRLAQHARTHPGKF